MPEAVALSLIGDISWNDALGRSQAKISQNNGTILFPTFASFGTFPTGATGVTSGITNISSNNGVNAIVGMCDNNLPPNTDSFPTAVTGYATLNSHGGQAFGIFARVDVNTNGTGVNELNSWNFNATPSGSLPPNLGIGTTDTNSIGLQIVPYGNYNSSIGLQIVPGVKSSDGVTPILYRTALYLQPGSFTDNGIYIDATSLDTAPGIVLRRGNAGQHLYLETIGIDQPNQAILTHQNNAGTVTSSIRQNGDYHVNNVIMTGTTQYPSSASSNTVGSAGSAPSLPSNPLGYIVVSLNGTNVKIPYYNA